ncbi:MULTISPECIES: hypothetical protein [unclassified Rhodanobacter]|uniref:hypothetical protein n=1 Tax=unclassified Rhodanobacter TaxID=2621553 RepID=UPI0007A9AA0E|nr:hypothetical protein [Rhodanobacter sp. FW510-R10]KZC32607.1 hypothetical protein RhoFW510R10_11880 [Rhodanobacter sp. FW510-R10]
MHSTETTQGSITFPEEGAASAPRELLLAEARMLDASHADLQTIVDRVTSELAENRCASFTRFDPMARSDGMHCVPSRLFVRMVERVGQVLSPSETPLSLDVDDLREYYFTHVSLAKRAPFTCVDLVERLLARFAPRASEIAHQQAALKFARVFGLRYQKATTPVSGRIILQQGASVDVFWSPARYGFHTQSSVSEHLNALATCLPFANPSVDAEDVRQDVRDVLRELELRNWEPARDFRGEVAGVQIRLFKSAVKYHFPLAHVQALNVFCVEHAPEYFAGH